MNNLCHKIKNSEVEDNSGQRWNSASDADKIFWNSCYCSWFTEEERKQFASFFLQVRATCGGDLWWLWFLFVLVFLHHLYICNVIQKLWVCYLSFQILIECLLPKYKTFKLQIRLKSTKWSHSTISLPKHASVSGGKYFVTVVILENLFRQAPW